MEIIDFFYDLKAIENDLYGSIIYLPECDSIEWSYDGLANPNIFNEDQLYDVYNIDYDIILSYVYDDNIVFNEPQLDFNTISFEINII